jgi:hypothetical protein
MAVTVCVPLFGHPGRELEEVKHLRGQHLRQLAASLQERLDRAADLLDRLTADGWSTQLAMYDVIVTHPQVNTQEEANQRLQALGVNPEEVLIVEDVEDEED